MMIVWNANCTQLVSYSDQNFYYDMNISNSWQYNKCSIIYIVFKMYGNSQKVFVEKVG